MIAQMAILVATEGTALIPRIIKGLLYAGNIVNDFNSVSKACEEDVDEETETGNRRRVLLSLRPDKSTDTRDPSTCASGDTKEFVVVMGPVVKGVYTNFKAAYEAIVAEWNGMQFDSDSEPHAILEVTQSGAEDPSKLEFEDRRQELGMTSGFIRYWKDGKDIEKMMEQTNNFLLLNYPDCFDLVRSFLFL